ncbi:hypothetical protein [Hymenobacter nivis]|uniref:Uncharacterized protein n=1 Tax=Hymenobacter nivis TaxID=1850093 RepID=A0A502GQ74_9BACT|nr:hypothetical protein [Hymenobacter nivis]TPG64487.1 hypothetical protein EAH73_15035 [Hymenobacter nivis]
MRSTPHQDPTDAAADAADTVAAKATAAADTVAAKAHDAADAASQKLGDAADTVAAKAQDAKAAASQKLGDAADATSKKFDDATAAASKTLDDAVAQGKEWLQNLDLQGIADQIPQSVKDLGAQVADRVRRLSPTQQIVGGALLAFSVGLLATHSSRKARHADAKAGKHYRAKFD